MPILDTHCHLHGMEYSRDLNEVILRAKEAGLSGAVLIGVDLEDSARAIAMAHGDEGFFRAVAGVHPHEAKSWDSSSRERLEELLSDSTVCALGEIGLDYHYDFSPRDQQQTAFLAQLDLARNLKRPIVIHCREAYENVLAVLTDYYADIGDQINGVLHCYFGSPEQAEQAASLGFIIGVGGACTFKKAEELHEVVKQTPLDRMVLETDAPYMAPVPYRGKRNEPAYLQYVVARIAELKELPAENVVNATTGTARRLYR